MKTNNYLFGFILTLSLSTSNAQQQYSGNSVMACNNSDETGPSPSFLYTCNGKMPSCQSFLMFKTKPPYLSVSSISNLTSSDPGKFAEANDISRSEVLHPDTDVFVPVTCSCSGKYYQANTSYVTKSDDRDYLTIANETYQGLTTCDSLKSRNSYSDYELYAGLDLRVPLRCACPTEEQIADGTRFLLTYLISPGDTVFAISKKFEVSMKSVHIANGFSGEDPLIFPFTTVLIPLPNEPQTRFFAPAPSYPLLNHNKSHKWLYVGIGVGAALAVLCFVLLLVFLHYRRKRTIAASWELEQGQMKEKLPEHFLDKVVGIGETLKIYTFDELEAATDNFSLMKRLTDSVYHGILRGKLLAIKKTSTDVSNEIKILSNINHFNVISLYGVCEHDGVLYLVYEYLEEGCLKDWLHRDDSPLAHSWRHRILIALDVANGLDYLHNFTSPAYVHKDINSSNILLNSDLRAKIAGFSRARENCNSHASRVVGKRGYIAPEYVQDGVVTPKIDVYAFGVVLLELITGREAVFLRDGEQVLLSETVISTMDERRMAADLIDPRLQVKHPLGYVIDHTELALRLLRLSIACLARAPASRLSMAEVVSALMKIQPDIHHSQSFSQ